MLKTVGNRKKLLIKIGDKKEISIGSWSAGQREFMPLMLGLYYVIPPSKIPRKDKIDTIIIEEPEAGLHPEAIVTVLLLVMELLNRDYKVIISTHSNTVLDVIWTLQEIKQKDCELKR